VKMGFGLMNLLLHPTSLKKIKKIIMIMIMKIKDYALLEPVQHFAKCSLLLLLHLSILP